MKIKRIYFKEMIINLGHKNNADSTTHKIEQVDQGYLIDDKIFVPYSNCKEVLIETEIAESVSKSVKPKLKAA